MAVAVTCAVAVAVFAGLPASVAQAAPATPVSAERQQQVEQRLERLYQREQNVLENEDTRLTKANDAVARAQQFIADQKSKGRDTSTVESALATFQSSIATAKTYHDSAAAALSSHAGFDANGKVTDVQQARSTLRTAGVAEQQFHLTIRRATVDLLTIIRQFRLANLSTPVATPASGTQQ